MTKLTGQMMGRVRQLAQFAMLAATVSLVACDSSGTPTSATATASAPAAPTYTVTDVVTSTTASDSTVVAGVFVQETRTLLGATTGVDGTFRISGVPLGNSVLRATKDGYDAVTTSVMLTADVRVDLVVVATATYTLSGVVFELTAQGAVPLEDVEVYCDSCGSPSGHTFAYTDTAGFYSFSWARNGAHPLLVRRAGYLVANTAPAFPDGTGRVVPSVNGDTRFDIQLVRR